jgi:hypothetical protein
VFGLSTAPADNSLGSPVFNESKEDQRGMRLLGRDGDAIDTGGRVTFT